MEQKILWFVNEDHIAPVDSDIVPPNTVPGTLYEDTLILHLNELDTPINMHYFLRLWDAEFPNHKLTADQIIYEADGEHYSFNPKTSSEYQKYPRTLHLPWSPGYTEDDVRNDATDMFDGKHVVVLEKLDGENTTMYSDKIHARSIDSPYHPSRTWVNRLHGEIGYQIPEGWRVCGENMQAVHSVEYEQLPSYFFVFSIWNENNQCLSWAETKEWAQLLGLETVPEIYEGIFDAKNVQEIWDQYVGPYGEVSEGYVIRLADGFDASNFATSIAKWVRSDHVQTDTHWIQQEMKENGFKTGKVSMSIGIPSERKLMDTGNLGESLVSLIPNLTVIQSLKEDGIHDVDLEISYDGVGYGVEVKTNSRATYDPYRYRLTGYGRYSMKEMQQLKADYAISKNLTPGLLGITIDFDNSTFDACLLRGEVRTFLGGSNTVIAKDIPFDSNHGVMPLNAETKYEQRIPKTFGRPGETSQPRWKKKVTPEAPDPDQIFGSVQKMRPVAGARTSIMMGLTPQEFYDKYKTLLHKGDFSFYDAEKAYEMLSRPDLPETHKFKDLIDLAWKRSQGENSPTEEMSPEKTLRMAQGAAIVKAYADVAKVIYFMHPNDRSEDEVIRILKSPYGEPDGYYTYEDMIRKVFGDYRIRDSEKKAPLRGADPQEIYQATLKNIMAYGLKPLGVDSSIFEGLDFNVELDPSSQMRKQRHQDILDKWPKLESKVSNILDPIHEELDQRVFDGTNPKMEYFNQHLHHVRETFRQNGFDPKAFEFYLTGSICTYQYSETSDCDVTIVCKYDEFPEIDRADLVKIVTMSLDGEMFPGTPYPFQHFIQPEGVQIEDLFPIGLRSAYNFQNDDWISPPDPSRVVDIQGQYPDWMQEALQWSEKMNILIDGGHYDDAFDVYKQLHEKRKEAMEAGLGDISSGNVFYKFVINNGSIDRLRGVGFQISTHVKESALPEYDIDPYGNLLDTANDVRIKPVLDDNSYEPEADWNATGTAILNAVGAHYKPLVIAEWRKWYDEGDRSKPPQSGYAKVTFFYNGYVRKVPKNAGGKFEIQQELEYSQQKGGINMARSHMDENGVLMQEEVTPEWNLRHEDMPDWIHEHHVDSNQVGWTRDKELRAYDP